MSAPISPLTSSSLRWKDVFQRALDAAAASPDTPAPFLTPAATSSPVVPTHEDTGLAPTLTERLLQQIEQSRQLATLPGPVVRLVSPGDMADRGPLVERARSRQP